LILFSPFRIILYLPLSIRYLGLFFIILGSSLTVYAILSLKENLKPSPKPRAGGCLVATGLYSIVRHPAYSCILLTALGISLWVNDIVRLLLTVGLFVFFNAKSSAEEIWLEKTYPEYGAYKRRVTKKFIPWVF
jgi:protein-S-isoprenylcysteine O-methyltransferase Ste14